MKAIRASKTTTTLLEQLEAAAVDISEPLAVDVVVNHVNRVVHVNVNGICVLRACRIEHLNLEQFGARLPDEDAHKETLEKIHNAPTWRKV